MLQITVIIPTYKDWTGVRTCLKALGRQTLPQERFEVIVADNNPENAPPEDLDLAENVRIVWQPKPGSYAARNAAVTEAKGAYLFFTDADCSPSDEWLATGLEFFERFDCVKRIAGGVVVKPADGVWNGWSVLDALFSLRQDKYMCRGTAVTANLAVRKTTFDEVGPFDEDRFSGGDMAWNRAATAANVDLLYCPDMSIFHPARDTFKENAGKVRRIAGARYAAKADRPVSQKMPRLKYLYPSLASYVKIWRRKDIPRLARLQGMWCHYKIGWLYNLEIFRLGLFGGTPNRT